MSTIIEEGSKALQEYIVSCSVIINSESPGFKHGTGVAVKYNDEFYIVTAAHVLKAEPSNERLLIIGRPNSALKMVKKHEISGQCECSPSTHITIGERIVGKEIEDIAALKLQNAKNELPHTVFHNLSDQGQTDISNGRLVVVCGFPSELERPVQHTLTGQSGVMFSSHHAWQKIIPISQASNELDPNVHFVTDFIYDQGTCSDPHGMSGGGAWTIPKIKDGEVWSAHRTQLLGIQAVFDRKRNHLGLVRIERVLSLLSKNRVLVPS